MTFGDAREIVKITFVAAFIAISSLASAAAGTWKLEYVPNDGDELTYTEDGKMTFYIGCGRGFGINVKYPGKAKKEGKAEVVISTSKGRQALKGEFMEPIEVEAPVPRKYATTFFQQNLNYPHADKRIFGDEWNAKKARLLDILDSGGPITVSAGKASIEYPAIDASGDWHKKIKECKFEE